MDYLKEAHPDWIEIVPIGKSSQGRPIQVIKLSRSRQPGVMEASQKKAILIDAGAAISVVLFFVFVSTFFARLITDTGNNFMDDGR